MPATPAWLAAVEATINRGISGSRQATAIARRLDGTSLRVDVLGVVSLQASITVERFGLALVPGPAESPSTANATISGSPFSLLYLAGVGRPPASGSRAMIHGDAEIANLYRQLFSLARPDVEEALARRLGDLPARRLGRLARDSLHWVRRVRTSAAANVAEYLQEESRDLVNRTELEEFLTGVDGVRETADRVAARLERLERAARPPQGAT